MPLPDEGPTTEDAIKAYLSISDGDDVDDARLSVIVPAVNALVRGLPVAQSLNTDPAPDAWTADITQGATMLGARLLRRYNSPEGVSAFGDNGPVYIQRNDPDIAMLLQLGQWSKPAVG